MTDRSEQVPVIAVASGKGGVGKTTVAVNLALALTAQGQRTGLIDADLYGPDVPRMMGLRRLAEASSVTLFARPGAPDSRLQTASQHGVQLASAAFLLGENQALAIQGGMAQLLVRRLLSDSDWGDLDYLVIDLPPGTADIQQYVFALSGRPMCVLVVVTPQVIAHQDVRRLVAHLKQQGGRGRAGTIDIAGVENMSGQVCPGCGQTTPLFPSAPEAVSIWGLIPRAEGGPPSVADYSPVKGSKACRRQQGRLEGGRGRRLDRMRGSMGPEGYSLAMNQEAGHGPANAASRGTGRPPRKQPARPSLGGGTPAQDRELRAQGRETVRKLLEAGMVEFEDRGFHGVRVDDVVRRAGISHGTFYLYFSNKEDLFKALLKDALHDMEIVAGDFPVVTADDTGLSVLRKWVRMFFRAYAAHATVIRILSQADLVPEEVFGDGLRLFFSIAEAMTTGMTAAAEKAGRHQEHAELTAVACLMMLERVNYLISAEVRLPEDEMADRIADIMYAAFGLNLA